MHKPKQLVQSLVGMAATIALILGGSTSASAATSLDDHTSTQVAPSSEVEFEHPDSSSSNNDYSDSTARSLIGKEMGSSKKKAATYLDSKVKPSLNLDGAQAPLPKETQRGLSSQDLQVLGTLPKVNPVTAEVSIPNPETREMFSLGAKNQENTKSIEGVAISESRRTGEVSVVSQIAADESGQILAVIKDNNTNYLDFKYTLPRGYYLSPKKDGGFNLISASSSVEGDIASPWAVDAAGRSLATHFELREDGTLRQHVDTNGAKFPITIDPSWRWLANAGKCAISLAPLLLTGGSAIAARVPKLISAINKLRRTVKIARAVRRVGGVKNAAVAIIKKVALTVRAKLPRRLAAKIPYLRPNSRDKAFIAVAWPFVVDNIWDWLGVGSCYSLLRGK